MTKKTKTVPKPSSKRKKDKRYYKEEQEQAVVDFLGTTDQIERERIYRAHLQKPIDKLVENIIRTYRLYRDEYTYEELHSDTLSYLCMKFDKFDPTKGNKSFSYFGTICRNYLYNEMKKAHKLRNSNVSYEEIMPSIIDDDRLSYEIDQGELNMNSLILGIAQQVEDEIEADRKLKELTDTTPKKRRNKKLMTQNEINVGYALIYILTNWRDLFGDAEGPNKFNKNLFYLFLREHTLLTTKEIRNAMKRYKVLYRAFRLEYEENNENDDIYSK